MSLVKLSVKCFLLAEPQRKQFPAKDVINTPHLSHAVAATLRDELMQHIISMALATAECHNS